MSDSKVTPSKEHFFVPTLNEQAYLVEKHDVETLLFCPESWALRHVFLNQVTGEVVRFRYNRWNCLFCGPRKANQWRRLVKAAEPTLFLTLTKASKTVEEAARALTTFLQYLRRAQKGKSQATLDCVKHIHLSTLPCWNGTRILKIAVFKLSEAWS